MIAEQPSWWCIGLRREC